VVLCTVLASFQRKARDVFTIPLSGRQFVGLLAFGLLIAVVRNAHVSTARERQRISQQRQEREETRNAAIETLDNLFQAAGYSDARAYENDYR
jgi:hypothetical protein